MKAENIKGFKKLNENQKDIFRGFLKNYLSLIGEDAKVVPMKVKVVRTKNIGVYIRFDFLIGVREEWMHVISANRWY